ncbi:hypothetical protein LCM20_09645 [Halobacillus litoralis]|uniref:hypothetical protein n=1 Tax=Halobacillus litoralis TaxID=45668 RepID=UPI001CD3AE9B|nr:hypothetical protein [Halobacillus litoralis]MCA0970853.1 hypothetical protein [Halobacillus litoralis]
MTKIIAPIALLLLGLSAILVGCTAANSAQEKDVETIEAMLTQQFTGPDQKMMELLNDPDHVTVIGLGETKRPEEPNELEQYLEATYHPYFTDQEYEDFIGAFAMAPHVFGEADAYQFEVEQVIVKDVEATDGAYDFTVEIRYEKDGTEENTQVSGRINVNEEGKISRYRPIDDGLMEVLQR